MSSSLRDALRQSGVLEQFKPVGGRETKPQSRSADARRGGKPGTGKPPVRDGRPHAAAASKKTRPRSEEEIDLAKAYALRAQSEQRERALKEQAEREVAERRRVQRERVATLLEGATLNREDAEIARHFEYGGKIRRVYVTDEQLEQVNDGRLGVIQMRGRYLLVQRVLVESVREVDAHAVALLVDPDNATGD